MVYADGSVQRLNEAPGLVGESIPASEAEAWDRVSEEKASATTLQHLIEGAFGP